jgi:hypothetical protein
VVLIAMVSSSGDVRDLNHTARALTCRWIPGDQRLASLVDLGITTILYSVQ